MVVAADMVGRQWKSIKQALLLCSLYSLQNFAFGMLRYSILEELEPGSFVGHIAQDLGIHVKDIEARKVGTAFFGENQYFKVNAQTGALFINERIDRERICGTVSLCVLTFNVVLENPLEVRKCEVEIQDINDNSPVFSSEYIELEISEATSVGARFPIENAEDSDLGMGSALKYNLSSTEYFSLSVTDSSKDYRHLELVLDKTLDREQVREHFLVLTAYDGGTPVKSGTARINVKVLDFNDNAPVFSQEVYKSSIAEGTAKDTLVLKLIATDKDEGSNGKITYKIRKTSEEARQAFKLDPVSGEIRVTGNVDYEKVKMYEMSVEAKDGGGLVAVCKVLIEVLDENDNAPQILISQVSYQLPENSAPGTTVGILRVLDLDYGDNGKTHCHVQEQVPFKLVSSFENYFTLVTSAALDRESVSQYNISITAIDKGSPSLSSTETICIHISDINDNSPRFSEAYLFSYIVESNTVGSLICSVKAKDPDWDQNGRITYSLMNSYVGESPVSTYVSVNPESGDVYALRSFDYEEFRDFQIQVQAKDGGSPPLSNNVTVKIFIIDQNDNSPQILYPSVANEQFTGIEIVPLPSDADYLVSKVVAVDADSGQNAWLSYQLLKASDSSLFNVGYHTGEIRTIRPVTAGSESTRHVLSVLVRDHGEPPLSSTATLTVFIADSFPQAISKLDDPINETQQNSSFTLYLVIALIAVSSIFIFFLAILLICKFRMWRDAKLVKSTSINYLGGYPGIGSELKRNIYPAQGYTYEAGLTSGSVRNDLKFYKPYSSGFPDYDKPEDGTMSFMDLLTTPNDITGTPAVTNVINCLNEGGWLTEEAHQQFIKNVNTVVNPTHEIQSHMSENAEPESYSGSESTSEDETE